MVRARPANAVCVRRRVIPVSVFSFAPFAESVVAVCATRIIKDAGVISFVSSARFPSVLIGRTSLVVSRRSVVCLVVLLLFRRCGGSFGEHSAAQRQTTNQSQECFHKYLPPIIFRVSGGAISAQALT